MVVLQIDLTHNNRILLTVICLSTSSLNIASNEGGADAGDDAGASPKLNAQKLKLTSNIVDKECAKYFNLKQIVSTIGK